MADDVPALDPQRLADRLQLGDEAFGLPVGGVAGMVRHPAVELVVEDHRALVGKAQQAAEVHMRAAGAAVNHDDGGRAFSDHAIDPHPHLAAFDLHPVLRGGD
jgi:hypothetical protein